MCHGAVNLRVVDMSVVVHVMGYVHFILSDTSKKMIDTYMNLQQEVEIYIFNDRRQKTYLSKLLQYQLDLTTERFWILWKKPVSKLTNPFDLDDKRA